MSVYQLHPALQGWRLDIIWVVCCMIILLHCVAEDINSIAVPNSVGLSSWVQIGVLIEGGLIQHQACLGTQTG